MTVFIDQGKYKLHLKLCTAFGPGCVKRRVSSNILIHKNTIFSKSTSKQIPHVLKFSTKNLFKTVRPIVFAGADLECLNVPVNDVNDSSYEKIPSQAIFEQIIVGAAYSFKNIYPNFELPSELKDPRCVFRKENESEEAFYLTFFNMLRDDVKKIHRYEQEVMKKDEGTPQLKDLSIADRIRFLSRQFCEICQARFGSYRKTKENKKCKILKNLDHGHVEYRSIFEPTLEPRPATPATPTLRRVLCQFCNWAMSQSADSPKNSRIIFLHNCIR